MSTSQNTTGCFKDARALRIESRRRGGFDDNRVERCANEGWLPKYWVHADDLLPPARSIPRSVQLKERDWPWLLEVWLQRPEGNERDAMLAECHRHIQPQPDAA